jgi:hypothetical protein
MSGSDLEAGRGSTPADVPEVTAPDSEPVQVLSPAVQRFQTCRWRKAAENGTPDHCTHRDVHPMAGTTGFSPDSWCLDCAHYKVRRNPRKRPAQSEDQYYY